MDNQKPKMKNFKYLDSKRLQDITDTFKMLKIPFDPNYSNAIEFRKNIQPVYNLKDNQYKITTSNSSN